MLDTGFPCLLGESDSAFRFGVQEHLPHLAQCGGKSGRVLQIHCDLVPFGIPARRAGPLPQSADDMAPDVTARSDYQDRHEASSS